MATLGELDGKTASSREGGVRGKTASSGARGMKQIEGYTSKKWKKLAEVRVSSACERPSISNTQQGSATGKR